MVPKTGSKKSKGKSKHLFILSREFAIVKEWQLNILPTTMNYFNKDKTNQYFDIRTNFLNEIFEKKKK